MFDYRTNCERCGRDLAIDDHQVYVCSFECTWCADCAATFPDHGCPNCGGKVEAGSKFCPNCGNKMA